MRNARLTAVLAFLVPVVLASGCGNDERSDANQVQNASAGWRHTSLWSLADASQRTQYGTRQQRAIRALSQKPGEPLRFSLELGEEAHFSFRPLVGPNHACTFSVSVHARARTSDSATSPPSTAHPAYAREHRPTGSTLSAVASVDLSAFAYQAIELVLETSGIGETECSPFWGSPSVADRYRGAALRGVASARPNVLFLTADTLRADALGAWGREPSGSPALDKLANESDVWLDAYSSINNTNPSFASLMTGLYVKNHRVFDLTTPLPEEHSTLAEVLSGAGYATRAVVSAAHLGRSGLHQGFAEFTQPGGQFFAETVVDIGLDWLQQGGVEPFFLWLHFFDAHTPHNPPQPFVLGVGPVGLFGMKPVAHWAAFREGGAPKLQRMGREGALGHPRLYASEVAYLDRQFDRLLDFLESHGLDENTIVVFVADHGETLGERQTFYNHLGLYAETTHVPLMIRWPGQREGHRIHGLVQHFDLFPTLLTSLGLAVPDQDGIDLRSVATGTAPREVVFANHANNRGEMLRTEEHLYLVQRKLAGLPDGPHLYSLAEDPRAQRDLARTGRPEEVVLRDRLRQWSLDRRKLAEPERREIDETERKQLEALGYAE